MGLAHAAQTRHRTILDHLGAIASLSLCAQVKRLRRFQNPNEEYLIMDKTAETFTIVTRTLSFCIGNALHNTHVFTYSLLRIIHKSAVVIRAFI